MQYISTGHNSPSVTLAQAVLCSHAPDGGLYMPASLPQIPDAFFRNFQGMTASEIAYVLATHFFSDDIHVGYTAGCQLLGRTCFAGNTVALNRSSEAHRQRHICPRTIWWAYLDIQGYWRTFYGILTQTYRDGVTTA